jgi:biopolymer transport protein ExbD
MQKGVFTNKLILKIPKKVFLLGLFVGISYTISLYLFLVGCRETWRYLSLMADGETFIALSDEEVLFYNFFFAFVSALTGFTQASDFWKRSIIIDAYVRTSIEVDQKGFQWYFNYWFTKLGLFFGIFCSTIPLFESFNFYPDYQFLFIMILVVLFLNQWTKARLFFRRSVFKYMLFVGIIQISLSVVMAFAPMNYSRSLNQTLLKQSPKYHCDYQLPSSFIASNIPRKNITFPLYFGKGKSADSIVLVAHWHKRLNLLTWGDLEAWQNENKETLPEFEHDYMAILLSVDKSIKMRDVKILFMQLRQINARNLFLMTNGLGLGIPWHLRPLCQQVFSGNPEPDWPVFDCSENNPTTFENRIFLGLKKNSISFNGKTIGMELSDSLISNIKKFQGSQVFEIIVDNESNYESFFRLNEYIRKAYLETWQEIGKEKYNLSLTKNDFAPYPTNPEFAKLIREIKGDYPANLIVWSDEEVEYFGLQK